MKVCALTTFVSEDGRHDAGDVFEMADHLAVARIQAGLVQRVPDEPETATLAKPEPEKAVKKRGAAKKRGR